MVNAMHRDLQALDRSAYIDYVRYCFSCYPEAFAYYEVLLDHLSPGADTPDLGLQGIELFEIANIRTPATYPRAFPFLVASLGERQLLPRIAILNGYPSPECVAFLGARWNIRPEFFIANLSFNGLRGSASGTCDLPGLPSLGDNLIQIPFISTVKSLVDKPKISLISHQRTDIDNACYKHEKNLYLNRRYGATRYRKVNLHDSQIFSIEQKVSLTIVRDGDTWQGKSLCCSRPACVSQLTVNDIAVFLTDQGRSDAVQEGLPWSMFDSERPVGTLALIPYNLPLDPEMSSVEGANHMALDQFHPLKRIVLRDSIDLDLLKTDPFYILAASVGTSLLSWSQLLAVMKELVKCTHDNLDLSQNELRYELHQLKYHTSILHQTKEQVSKILELVEEGGCASWPKAVLPLQIERKEILQRHLRFDCTNLIESCSLMIAECNSATAVLVGFAQVATAERAMAQALELQDLTKLATLFIPLGFATNIFSMNIKEWNPPPTVWYFIGTVVFVLAMTFTHLYRQTLLQATRKYLGRGKDL